MKELYVCVHVPELPAQALVRLRPEMGRGAVVVLEGDPPLEQVCSANAEALRMGVRHGMIRSELDCFAEVQMLRRSEAEERSAQEVLREGAGLFTPRVEVQARRGAAWVMVLDMAGTERIFGPVAEMVGRIELAMKGLSFAVRVAVSGNLHAAVSMAPSAARAPIVIPAGAEAEWLAGLEVATLGLTTQQAQAFELWGVSTLGELAALPEDELIVRLGQPGKRLRQLARGEWPHLMVPEEPGFALEELVELDAPVEALDSLLFLLGPMVGQLIRRAQNYGFALASVTVRLGLEGGGAHERTIKPALPMVDREVLLKLLHLDVQAHPPAAGVVGLRVSAEPGERSKVQLGLWSPALPEPMRLDVTLARIAALVGEDRVGCAVLKDTHRAESFGVKRFVVTMSVAGGERRVGMRGMPPRSMVPNEMGHTRFGVGSVALRRCRPSVVIQMRREGGRLSGFELQGKRYRVEQAYGPWRRSGDWWTSEVWSSEEWDVQAEGPESRLLCVVSHDLLGEQWRLEATYD
jgi:protein ImuB